MLPKNDSKLENKKGNSLLTTSTTKYRRNKTVLIQNIVLYLMKKQNEVNAANFTILYTLEWIKMEK